MGIMMSKTSMFLFMGCCLVAGLLVAGCTQSSPQVQTLTTAPTTAVIPATQVTQGSTALANPASVYCGQSGGTLQIKKDATGAEYGMCTFTNGTTCEEWALFRGEGCKPGVAAPVTTAPALSGLANPASVNCGKVGGSTVILKNPDGSEYGMCSFTNGTTCEEWALFRGEGCKTGNSTPVK